MDVVEVNIGMQKVSGELMARLRKGFNVKKPHRIGWETTVTVDPNPHKSVIELRVIKDPIKLETLESYVYYTLFYWLQYWINSAYVMAKRPLWKFTAWTRGRKQWMRKS